MTEDDFATLVADTFDGLPETYRELCEGLAIRTEEFPSQETRDALAITNPYDLLGLYHGISLAHKSVSSITTMPDTVLIYRKPILAYSEATGIPLAEVVRHVLIHELGHHFGFSDDDMDQIERTADET